jgi:hypothetical protein
MADFAFYYACPVRAQYDPKKQQYTRATSSTIKKGILRFHQMLIVTSILVSLYEYNPKVFANLARSSRTESEDWYHPRSLVDLSRLQENFWYAAFFQSMLTAFAEGMQLIQAAFTAIETEEMMSNPVFTATSPSDFWGRRWNLLIHDCLKRGVFLPVRRHYPNLVALIAAFFASGIFHEWLLLSVFPSWDHVYTVDSDGQEICQILGRGENDKVSALHCYNPIYGAAMGFFLWQAVLIALEFTVGSYFKDILTQVPGPVATLFTIIMGGCVAHWFAEPYVHSNFFLDVQSAFFLLKPAP